MLKTLYAIYIFVKETIVSDITAVQVLPSEIGFGPGNVLKLDSNTNFEGIRDTLIRIADHSKVDYSSPSQLVFDLKPNTTSNLLTALLECFPDINPTAAISQFGIVGLKLADGTSLPTLDLEVNDRRKVRTRWSDVLDDYGVKFSLDKHTGVYVLTVHSVDVVSAQVNVNYWNANRLQRA